MLKRSAIEFVRHLLHVSGADSALDKYRGSRGVFTGYLKGSLADRFDRIYAEGVWSKAGMVSGPEHGPGSGLGSSLAATQSIRNNLHTLLRSIDATQVLDVGCGDFSWMREVVLDIPYIGADIVKSVIENNNRLFGSDSRRFEFLNACEDDLPDADVVICREVLFHLSFYDIGRALRNMAKKRRNWLITTSDSGTFFNSDIRSGDFRIINLRRRPFNFPASFYTLKDDGLVQGRYLGAWRFEDIIRRVNC